MSKNELGRSKSNVAASFSFLGFIKEWDAPSSYPSPVTQFVAYISYHAVLYVVCVLSTPAETPILPHEMSQTDTPNTVIFQRANYRRMSSMLMEAQVRLVWACSSLVRSPPSTGSLLLRAPRME